MNQFQKSLIKERESSFRKEINHLYKSLRESSFIERDKIQESIHFLERELDN